MRTLSFSSLALVVLALSLPLGCGSDDDDGRKDGRPWKSDIFPPRPDLPSGTCSPANCTGCCQGSQCLGGTAVAACGYGGISCRACGSGEVCKDGVCNPGSTTCNAQSCSKGCCEASGNCNQGGTEQACGVGGAACKTCDGATESCMAGQCTPKGTGSYKIILVSAAITDTCGFGETCDPYVELTVAGTTKTSSYKTDSEKPVWNETLMTAKEADILAGLKIKILDDDWGPDDTIAECTLQVTATDLANKQIVQSCGTVKDLTFKFEPV